MACSCGRGTLEAAYRVADDIIVGEVVSMAIAIEGYHYLVYYLVAVSEVIKGRADRTFKIYTTDSGASCGYQFSKGHQYVLFCYNEEACIGGQFKAFSMTDICTHTQPYKEASYKAIQWVAQQAAAQKDSCDCFRTSNPLVSGEKICAMRGISIKPEFPSGEQAWLDYLTEREDARISRSAALFLHVDLSFVIDETGAIRDAVVSVDKKGCRYRRLQQQLLEALDAAPPWQPGVCGQRNVPVHYAMRYSVCDGVP